MTPRLQTVGQPAHVLIVDKEHEHRRDLDSILGQPARDTGSTATAPIGTVATATSPGLLAQSDLLDLAQDAIVVRDMQDRILLWSHGAEVIYGWQRHEALGESMQGLLQSQFSEPLEQLQATLLEADRWEGEAVQHRRDGACLTVTSRWALQRDADGAPARILSITSDVTARKAAEAARERVRADQLQFKDDFLANFSRELRSPLTAIRQFASILLDGLAGELNTEQRQYQQIILKNSQQLQSMIDDLLEVTRLESGRLVVDPRSVSVADAVNDSLGTLLVTARTKGVTVAAAVPVDLPLVYADDTRLRQILIILLDNAIKFTPAGGSVRIEAQRDPGEPGVVRISVSDTGCGVAPDLSSRVFERLYEPQTSTSRSGLGLGLHLCKELVTLQGGLISMTSRPLGAGTTVAFTVPIVSLEHVLVPLAPDGQWPAASLAVVTIAVRGTPGNRSRDPWTGWVHEARALIERCLVPERHVLLPRPPPSGADERFFIAAFTDEAGASALASRIAADFARMPVSLWPGMTVSVAHHMAGLPAPSDVDSTETPWRRLAVHLGRSLARGDDARGRPR